MIHDWIMSDMEEFWFGECLYIAWKIKSNFAKYSAFKVPKCLLIGPKLKGIATILTLIAANIIENGHVAVKIAEIV